VSEREGSGVARAAQHAVHVLPHASHVIARFLGPALERVAPDAAATQLLVITPDAETALAVAEVARAISDRSPAPIVPITAAGRGARLLGSRGIPAIAATPATLASLLRSSSVKLEGLRAVVVAWVDEVFAAREDDALEVVLNEIPKEASRVVVADQLTPEVEAFIERHLRRASRVGATEAAAPDVELPIRYVTTASTGRRSALRRLLDELDPPSAVVLANDAGGAEEARLAVAALGYLGDETVRVVTEPLAEPTALVVLYDLPASAAHLAQIAAGAAANVVALVSPRQIPALRRLTAGTVEPLDLSQAPAKARARDERVRSAIRAELEAGFPAREIMALEPLVAEFDGLEIAAAALRLFERERTEARVRRVETERPLPRPEVRADRAERPAAPRTAPSGFARIFLSIGDRDGIRAGDLVGAITGETGITSDRIGKLDIRENHTVAEIAADEAAAVIEKMNGVSFKGRRIAARLDDRPPPRSREGSRNAGGAREGRGGGRDARSGPRGRGGFGDRGRDRPPRDGASREGRSSREERPARGFGRARDDSRDRGIRRDDDRPRGRFRDRADEGRVPRAAREREEWAERGDRVRHARRPRRDEA